jgi:Flp pilus assembly protein TadD
MAGFSHPGVRETPFAGAGPAIAIQNAAKQFFTRGTSLLCASRFAEAEAALREALRLQPEDPDVLNNLGTAIWQQGRPAEASAYYLRAHQYNPKDHGILNNLGISLWDQGHPDRAVAFYRRALGLRPDSFDTRMNLGVSLSDLGDFDEALASLRSSLELEPNSADAWDNVGMTLARQNNWTEAMACYDRALALRPEFGEAHRNRALGWLGLGDFERGWPELEWRFHCRNPPGFRFPRPRWNGEDLGGRTVLLHWEQGLGDTLQFIRFAPLVKERGGRVWVLCQPPLVRLLALCPHIDQVFGKTPLPDFPLHAPLMSVPAIVGEKALRPESSYLFADRETIAHWRARLQGALGTADLTSVFKIGIAWQGNPENRIDRWRSLPLAQFAPLADLPGVRLISLQKGAGTEQLRAVNGRFPVVDLQGGIQGLEDKRDFLDTAAIMSSLDLVVTPETAVAHLASSLGVRTWVALSAVGDWRWLLDVEGCAWYPSARLFRQSRLGDWEEVFARMADALGRELSTRNDVAA